MTKATANTYPKPVPADLIERIIDQRCEMGWTFSQWDAERQENARLHLRIKLRLRFWLTEGLGLEPAKGLHPKHPEYRGPQNPIKPRDMRGDDDLGTSTGDRL
jgi:hypothetical protein